MSQPTSQARAAAYTSTAAVVMVGDGMTLGGGLTVTGRKCVNCGEYYAFGPLDKHERVCKREHPEKRVQRLSAAVEYIVGENQTLTAASEKYGFNAVTLRKALIEAGHGDVRKRERHVIDPDENDEDDDYNEDWLYTPGGTPYRPEDL